MERGAATEEKVAIMTPHIAVAREEIATFCQQHHIRWLVLFGGRTLGLRTPQDLSRYFRDEVLKEAEVQYAIA